jgi:predicted  nucleic acid-binding Zn-ribbon protein
VTLSALMAGACDANRTTIFRQTLLDEGHTLVTDAQQRIITNTDVGDYGLRHPGQLKPRRVVCLEPSPDVAQIFSDALSFAVKTGAPNGPSGQAGYATTTSLGQLVERLATIQLLRDELSYLCRAYANGSVSTTTYTLRLSRLDKKMVTLLMGEMAAGAFGRDLLTLASATQAAIKPTGSGPDISAAKGALDTASDDLKTKQEAYDAALNALAANPGDANLQSQLKVEQKAYEASLGTFNRKNAEFVRLTLQNASAGASSSAGVGLGGIGGGALSERAKIANEITRLQRNYLDEDDLGTMVAACISATDRLSAEETNATELDAALAKLNDEASGLKANLEVLTTEIAKKNAGIAENEKIKEDIEAREKELFDKNKALEAEQTEETPELKKDKAHRASLNSSIFSIARDLNRVFGRIIALREQARRPGSDEASSSALQKEIQTAENKQDELELKLRSLQDQLRVVDDRIERTENRNKLEIQANNDELERLRKRRTDVSESLKELRDSLPNHDRKLAETRAKHDANRAEYKRLSDKNDNKDASAFAGWCRANLKTINTMIHTQHMSQFRLRELEIKEETRQAGFRLCQAVMTQGEKADNDAKAYCSNFLASSSVQMNAAILEEQLPAPTR